MALVSKILEATLTAGSTAVVFTDSDIPNSLIRVFSSDSTVIPESRMLSGNTLTVVYPAQTSTLYVALEIVKQGLDIVDNVLSEDTDKALSAKQGYLLSAAIGDNADNISILSGNLETLTETVNNLDIPDSITDLDDINITSIQNGQVLAWNATSQKFVNVNQSGGSSETYTTDEREIGTYLGVKLYQKTFHILKDDFTNTGTNTYSYSWTLPFDSIVSINAILKTSAFVQIPNGTINQNYSNYISSITTSAFSMYMNAVNVYNNLQYVDVTLKYTKAS